LSRHALHNRPFFEQGPFPPPPSFWGLMPLPPPLVSGLKPATSPPFFQLRSNWSALFSFLPWEPSNRNDPFRSLSLDVLAFDPPPSLSSCPSDRCPFLLSDLFGETGLRDPFLGFGMQRPSSFSALPFFSRDPPRSPRSPLLGYPLLAAWPFRFSFWVFSPKVRCCSAPFATAGGASFVRKASFVQGFFLQPRFGRIRIPIM